MSKNYDGMHLLANLQILNRKFYSYAFMKIMVFDKEQTTLVFQKIRHYDIQCEAANRISDLLKEKINTYKMSCFLKLKFQKGTYLVRKNKPSRQLKYSRLSVGNNHPNPEQFDQNPSSKRCKISKKCQSVTSNSRIKKNSSREKLVKTKNYDSTNKHAQKISNLLDKARQSISQAGQIISVLNTQQDAFYEVEKQNTLNRKKRNSQKMASSTKNRQQFCSMNSVINLQTEINYECGLKNQQLHSSIKGRFARLRQNSRNICDEFKNIQKKFI